MKFTLLRLSALLLTFSVGLTIPRLFKSSHSIESSAISPVVLGTAIPSRCASSDHIVKGSEVVISIPNDGELYLGKRKVGLAEISSMTRKVSGNPDQVIYIKIAAGVRFETVSLVADAVRAGGGVNCIEFVLDKKKRSK